MNTPALMLFVGSVFMATPANELPLMLPANAEPTKPGVRLRDSKPFRAFVPAIVRAWAVVNAGGLVDVCALALTARASRPMVAIVQSFSVLFMVFLVDGF